MKKKKNICKKCGQCCYFKIMTTIGPVFSKNHCEFLDEKTKKCTIYKNRFKINPKCLTVEQAISIQALPNNCPYVQNIKNYQGPK